MDTSNGKTIYEDLLEPRVIGQCQICTRVVKTSTYFCKNCYWQCDNCKQVRERLRYRRRFYNGRILCDGCYRDESYKYAFYNLAWKVFSPLHAFKDLVINNFIISKCLQWMRKKWRSGGRLQSKIYFAWTRWNTQGVYLSKTRFIQHVQSARSIWTQW